MDQLDDRCAGGLWDVVEDTVFEGFHRVARWRLAAVLTAFRVDWRLETVVAALAARVVVVRERSKTAASIYMAAKGQKSATG